jgi:predicted transcriptional regulator
MVRLVRAGMSMHVVAERLGVSLSTVSFWVQRAKGRRLERADFSDRKSGCAWNRLAPSVEQHIAQLRKTLREESVLGEYGAQAIHAALSAKMRYGVPSIATINRALSRQGLQDGARRIRRPPPPKGWYLPALATGEAELDSFDLIEELKIADGPLVWILNGTSLHGGLVDSWPLEQATAKLVLTRVLRRWQRDGLPTYAQFDNGTQFQGAHQFPDTVGRIGRLCLALGVIPVFAPPREPGFQNAIEGFNGLWQAKVWQRQKFKNVAQLEAACERYVAAHRARSSPRQEKAPKRPIISQEFTLNLNAKLKGTMIYLRRTDERGHAHLLGQRFEVCERWPHRLLRCEVNFTEENIRFYALRRRDPQDQPLLHELPYRHEHKPFQGTL